MLEPLQIVALLLLSIFVLGWLLSILIKNVSIVDAMWALALPFPVIIYLIAYEGTLARNLLLLGMALIWSLRLGGYLLNRIVRHHPVEDPRYQSLRKHWGSNSNRNFLGIFILNAAIVYVLSMPFYYSAQNETPLSILEYLGLAIFTTGLIGESIADYQLSSFKKKHTAKQVCNTGLWRYSRHPNYFFEAVIWLGVYVFACRSESGLYSVYAPALIIFLLTCITGIPPAERSLLNRKGEAYRTYQAETSAFIPWFKKKNI